MILGFNKILLLWALTLYDSLATPSPSPLFSDMVNRKSKTASMYNERETGATFAPIGENIEHQDTMQIMRNLHKQSKTGSYNNMQQKKEINPNVKETNLEDKVRQLELPARDTGRVDYDEKVRVSRKTFRETDDDDSASRRYQVETPVGSGSLVLDLHLKMEPPAPSACCCENENSEIQNKENCWKVNGRWQCLVTTPFEECVD